MFDRVLGRENPCAFKLIFEKAAKEEKTPFDKLREKEPKLYDLIMNYLAVGLDSIEDLNTRVLLGDLLHVLNGNSSTLVSLARELQEKNDRLKRDVKELCEYIAEDKKNREIEKNISPYLPYKPYSGVGGTIGGYGGLTYSDSTSPYATTTSIPNTSGLTLKGR